MEQIVRNAAGRQIKSCSSFLLRLFAFFAGKKSAQSRSGDCAICRPAALRWGGRSISG